MKSILTKMVIILVVASIFVGCNENAKSVWVHELEQISSKTYEDGVTIEDALRVISKATDYSESRIVIEELTSDEIWKNSKQQIFRFSIDSAMVDSIAVFQNGDLRHVLSGQNINKVVIADLNSDNVYEVCMTSTFGFGNVTNVLKVYDTQENKAYEYELEPSTDEYILDQDISILPNFEENEVDLYLKDWSLEEIEIIVFDQTNEETADTIEIVSTDQQNNNENRGALLGRLRIVSDELTVLSY